MDHHPSCAAPLLMLAARPLAIAAAHGLAALCFLARGHAHPWLAAAPYWTVWGTFADALCLCLLASLLRREGLTLRAQLSAWRPLRDLGPGLGYFLAVFPLFLAGGLLAGYLLYGSIPPPDPFPGLQSARHLPLWAVLYSRSLWWLIWSPTEELTYNGFALPRLASALSPAGAVALTTLAWAAQHSLLPALPDLRYLLFHTLAFIPGVAALCLLYLRTRRLGPLIAAHWMMDFSSTFLTIN